MTCLEAKENLGAHAAGQLPLAAALHVNQHLRQCARCRERYETVLDQDRLRRTVPIVKTPVAGGGLRRAAIAVEFARRTALRARSWAAAVAGFLFVAFSVYAASQWVVGRFFVAPVAQASTGVTPAPPPERLPARPPAAIIQEPTIVPVEAAPPKRTRRPRPKPAAPTPAFAVPPDPSAPALGIEPLQLVRNELPLGRFAGMVDLPAPAPPPAKVAVITGLGTEPVAVPVGRPPHSADLEEAAVIIHNLGPEPIVLPVRRRELPALASAAR